MVRYKAIQVMELKRQAKTHNKSVKKRQSGRFKRVKNKKVKRSTAYAWEHAL